MQPAITFWHEPVLFQVHLTPASRRRILILPSHGVQFFFSFLLWFMKNQKRKETKRKKKKEKKRKGLWYCLIQVSVTCVLSTSNVQYKILKHALFEPGKSDSFCVGKMDRTWSFPSTWIYSYTLSYLLLAWCVFTHRVILTYPFNGSGDFFFPSRHLESRKCKKGKVFPLQTRLWPRGWVEL